MHLVNMPNLDKHDACVMFSFHFSSLELSGFKVRVFFSCLCTRLGGGGAVFVGYFAMKYNKKIITTLFFSFFITVLFNEVNSELQNILLK